MTEGGAAFFREVPRVSGVVFCLGYEEKSSYVERNSQLGEKFLR